MDVERHVEGDPLAEGADHIIGGESLGQADTNSHQSEIDKGVNSAFRPLEFVSVAVEDSSYEENVEDLANGEEPSHLTMSVRVVEHIIEPDARSKDDGQYDYG